MIAGPVVDVHTHVVPNGWPDLAVVTGSDGWPWLRVDSEKAAMIMVGDGEYRPIGAACWSAAERLADMDADGIDRQVVSPTPLFFGYQRDAGEAVKVAKIFNDLTLECVADGGDRLIPFCQVPASGCRRRVRRARPLPRCRPCRCRDRQSRRRA